VLEHKMLLDGVEYDGITSKDWMRTFRQRRPGRLREQVGFKVNALLEGRLRRPLAREYLFGDDLEQDAAGFKLYSRLLAGELSGGAADGAMEAEGVKPDDRRCAMELLDRLPENRGTVERIFIHLQRNTPPSEFEKFGDIVVPVKGAGQLALALYELDLLDREAVDQALEEVLAEPGRPDGYAELLVSDALERALISRARLDLAGMSGAVSGALGQR
jgi:hypothetical protein